MARPGRLPLAGTQSRQIKVIGKELGGTDFEGVWKKVFSLKELDLMPEWWTESPGPDDAGVAEVGLPGAGPVALRSASLSRCPDDAVAQILPSSLV